MRDVEKETIEQALQSLNDPEGAAVMGNFKNLANWIATVHLQGTHTPQRVQRYLAHLVARLHKSAVEAGKTSRLLQGPPEVQGLTQIAEDACDEPSNSECESDPETGSDAVDSDME